MNCILNFFKKNWLISLLLLLSLALRLWQIDGYMTFLGDEGRDALVWLHMVRNGKFTLIGPQTSIGNMYLGPLYYYLMLPLFILFGLSPVGPAVEVALFGVATVFLIWRAGREWFSEKAGLMAAFLYAVSPVVIVYSHSSWNPNVMPFFALLTIYGIYQFWQKEKFVWLPIIGVTLSFALQSHYLGILLVPLVFFFQALTFWKWRQNKLKLKKFILLFVICYLLFVIFTFVPLIWFDLRHNFINTRAFYQFFSVRQTTVNLKIYKAVPQLWSLWEMMTIRLLAAKEAIWGKWLAVLLLVGLAIQRKIWFKRPALQLIAVWLLVGLLGMGLYKQHIYDHYFGFLFPAPFLLAGFLLEKVLELRKTCLPAGRFGILGFLILASYFSIKNSPLRYPPNCQMGKTSEIAKVIQIDVKKNKNYNIANLAPYNDYRGMAYRYFLERLGASPLSYENYQDAELLYVIVDENNTDKDPLKSNIWEIKSFGLAKIENQWEFPWGVKLFRLVR